MKMPNVLITGANRGLGLEFARQYALDGWTVIATCRAPEKAAALKRLLKEDVSVQIFQLDVTDPKSIARLANGLKNRPIDILINNAGVVGKGYKKTGQEISLNKVDYKEFQRVFETNVFGPLRVTEALLPNLKKGKGKKLVSISSRSGSITNAWNDAIAYGVSKAGLNYAMRGFSFDLKKFKILALNLCPGWTRTDMGSKKATHAVDDSVARLKKVIDKSTMKDTGRYLDRNGKDIPW
jgi:NAD(P)-dependent dehydrogenase (short-subunit alcohol dehydrogenase family)